MSSQPTEGVSSGQRYIRFECFEVDLSCGELRRNGVKVKLQEQPFRVLLMLLRRPGDVVTRDQLRQELWPNEFVDFDHSLDTAIKKLRDALGDSAGNPRYIQTLPKRGYRFTGKVEGQPDAAAPSSGEHDIPRRNPALVRVLFGLLQLMYLAFYLVALGRMEIIRDMAMQLLPGRSWLLAVPVFVTATVGVPVRLYFLTAVAFDYTGLGRNFLRLFPLIVALDWFWALAPLLFLQDEIRFLAYAATAALLYVPFSQRTLILMRYPPPNSPPPLRLLSKV